MKQTIFIGDSTEINFDLGKIDLIVTAPPHIEDDKEYKEMALLAFAEMFQALKDDAFCVSITHDVKNIRRPPRHIIIYQSAIKAGFEPYELKIWHRRESLNLFRKTFAYIFIFAKGNPKYLEPDKEFKNDVWLVPFDMKVGEYDQAFHQELPERCIKAMSRPGERVLDPFVGTGTTLRAAEKLGREGIGIEIDPGLKKYWEPTWEIK